MASTLDAATARIAKTATMAHARTISLLDRFIAPQQRSEFRHHVTGWAHRHPNLALLTGLCCIFIGPPMALFALFAIATLLTFFSIAFLLALGASAIVLGTLGIFVLAPAIFLGTVLALGAFVSISITTILVQRLRPGASVDEVIEKSKTNLDGATDKIRASMPKTSAALSRTTVSGVEDRPDPPSRTVSDREHLARQALGIPPTVPLATSTEAAVAAAAERQRLQNEQILSDDNGALASPDRMKLEEQIRLGEEIARRALEGKLGVTVS